mmetsp:Transcript_83359/g.236244  ORF Transcript_83359/g.236244 Transcript_83359/m.236244 type:complete len:201 (+) Transcript_83359:748-1350(+)
MQKPGREKRVVPVKQNDRVVLAQAACRSRKVDGRPGRSTPPGRRWLRTAAGAAAPGRRGRGRLRRRRKNSQLRAVVLGHQLEAAPRAGVCIRCGLRLPDPEPAPQLGAVLCGHLRYLLTDSFASLTVRLPLMCVGPGRPLARLRVGQRHRLLAVGPRAGLRPRPALDRAGSSGMVGLHASRRSAAHGRAAAAAPAAPPAP